jgi:hypothetical protein
MASQITQSTKAFQTLVQKLEPNAAKIVQELKQFDEDIYKKDGKKIGGRYLDNKDVSNCSVDLDICFINRTEELCRQSRKQSFINSHTKHPKVPISTSTSTPVSVQTFYSTSLPRMP